MAQEVPWTRVPGRLGSVGWELRCIAVARSDRLRDSPGSQTTHRPGGPALALIGDREEWLSPSQPVQPCRSSRFHHASHSPVYEIRYPYATYETKKTHDSALAPSDRAVADRRKVRQRGMVTASCSSAPGAVPTASSP